MRTAGKVPLEGNGAKNEYGFEAIQKSVLRYRRDARRAAQLLVVESASIAQSQFAQKPQELRQGQGCVMNLAQIPIQNGLELIKDLLCPEFRGADETGAWQPPHAQRISRSADGVADAPWKKALVSADHASAATA